MNKLLSLNQSERMRASRTAFGIASIACFILFLLLAVVVRQFGFNDIDPSIMLFVYEFRTPSLTEFMKGATFFGSTGLIIVALLASLTLFAKRHLRPAAWFLILVGSGAAANAILKKLVARPRPTLAPLIRETDFSFPSGHAMDSLIVYGAIAFLLMQLMPKSQYRLLAATMAVLIIAVIGFSRIYLGVHFPSDVLAGYLFGAGWLLVGAYFYTDFV